MFGSGYGRAQASTNPFEDDDEPSGGMLGSLTDDQGGSGTSSSFGSRSMDRGGGGKGDPFEKRSMDNKDSWLQGKDEAHDPFNSNGSPAPKKSSSISGVCLPLASPSHYSRNHRCWEIASRILQRETGRPLVNSIRPLLLVLLLLALRRSVCRDLPLITTRVLRL